MFTYLIYNYPVFGPEHFIKPAQSAFSLYQWPAVKLIRLRQLEPSRLLPITHL